MAIENLDWLDDEHVLLDGSIVIDLRRQVVLWKYKISGGRRAWGCVFDGTLSYLYMRNAGQIPQAGVYFAALPQPEVLQAADSLKPEEFLAVRPGTKVSLELQGAVNGDDLQKLTAALEEQLTKKEISVAAGSPISLRATVENGKSETKTYRSIGGRGRGEETVTSTQRIFRLALVENGKVLWEATGGAGGTPTFLHTQNGESAQAAVDRLQQSSPLWFFSNVQVPRRVVRYGEEGCFGVSELGPATNSAR